VIWAEDSKNLDSMASGGREHLEKLSYLMVFSFMAQYTIISIAQPVP
jgi:hypothetical protein